jgi:hypothetical protein
VRAALDAYERAATIAAMRKARSSNLGTTFRITDTFQCPNPAIFLNPSRARAKRCRK